SSTTWPALRRATELGISLLSTEQQALARQLASKDHARRFSGVDPEVSADGALTIPGSSTLLWTRHYSEFAAGDHTVALLGSSASAARKGPKPSCSIAVSSRVCVCPDLVTGAPRTVHLRHRRRAPSTFDLDSKTCSN